MTKPTICTTIRRQTPKRAQRMPCNDPKRQDALAVASSNPTSLPSPLSLTYQANTFSTEPPLLHTEPTNIPVSRGYSRSVRTMHAVGVPMDFRVQCMIK